MNTFHHIQRFGRDVHDGLPDRDRMGGKGASLAAMGQADLPIPPGFTISIDCCRQYIETGQWPELLSDELDAAMTWLEETTGRRYGQGERPLLVSVRSGAAVSMPGMMDTLLNCGLNIEAPHAEDPRFRQIYETLQRSFANQMDCPLPTDPLEMLHRCIEAVWCSWNSPRAITYRQRHSLNHLNGTAVNIQAMFPSQVSGVVFTVDPAQPDNNNLIIEAAFGLGESVVAGDVTPDHCRVDRDTRVIQQYVTGQKASIVRALGDAADHDPDARCLNDEQIVELADLCLRVEAHRETPVDVEFGWAAGEFAILQSRPIRGLEVVRDVQVGRNEMIRSLRERSEGKRRLWIRHNLDETLSHPTPMTWDIMRRFMRGQGGFGRMYCDLGYRQDKRFQEEGFLDCIGGRIFADTDRAVGIFWDGMPLTYDLDALQREPGLIDQPPTVLAPEQTDHRFLLSLPLNLWSMYRATRRIKRLRPGILDHFQHHVLPNYLVWIDHEREQHLDAMNVAQLITLINDRRRRVLDEFGGESLKPGFLGSLAYAQLSADLVMIFGPDEGRELALRLMMGLDDDMTVEQNQLLFEVAHKRTTLDEFVARYGHRALDEMELAQPRWREDAQYLQQMLEPLRQLQQSPRDRHEVNKQQRLAVEQELPDRLAACGGLSLWEKIQTQLHEAQRLLPWRENAKGYLMQGYELIRQALLALGNRWQICGDVFYLELGELQSFESQQNKLRDVIALRKTRRESQRRLDMPTVIDSNNLDDLGSPRHVDADVSSILKGEGISAGVMTGTARLVTDPTEARDLGKAAILVCHSTDPAWTALFAQVHGVIVERGGALSHGAIVARDFGLPAVVCPDATRLITDGQRITVDGNVGRIVLLTEEMSEAQKGVTAEVSV